MDISLTIRIALRGLFLNKVRAFLTLLGVVIGVAGIIVIVSVGNGAESLVVNQINSIGANLIGVLPGGRDEGEPPAALFGIVITTLKNEDLMALGKIRHVVAVSGYNKSVEPVQYAGKKVETTVTGVFSSYPLVEDASIREGRFFSFQEDVGLKRVAVLGSAVARDLFDGEDPVGKRLKIHNQSLRVIGVLNEKGVSGFSNNDAMVFVPSRVMQKLILGVNHVAMGRVKVDDAEFVDSVTDEIVEVLRVRHHIVDPKDDDFTVASQSSSVKTIGAITGGIKLFLTLIAFVALVVGGIGIMNVMYVSVTERIREIGLRKALGARRRDILRQFLIEAVVITFIGGVIGVFVGFVISLLIALLMNFIGYSWDFIVSVDSVFYAVVVIVGVGIVFGYAPAKKASEFNAIDALRYE